MTLPDDREFVTDENATPQIPTLRVHIESSDVREGLSAAPEFTSLNTYQVPALANAAAGIEPGIQILGRRYRRHKARIWVTGIGGAGSILFAPTKDRLSQALQALNNGSPIPVGVLQIQSTQVPTGTGGIPWDGQQPCYAGTAGIGPTGSGASGVSNGITPVTSAANAANTATIAGVTNINPVLTQASVSFSAATTSVVTVNVTTGVFTLGTYTLPTGTTEFNIPLPPNGLLGGGGGNNFQVSVSAAGVGITSTINMAALAQGPVTQNATVTVLDESYASIKEED